MEYVLMMNNEPVIISTESVGWFILAHQRSANTTVWRQYTMHIPVRQSDGQPTIWRAQEEPTQAKAEALKIPTD